MTTDSLLLACSFLKRRNALVAFAIFFLFNLNAQELNYNKELARQSSIREWTDPDSAIAHWTKEYESDQSNNNLKYKGDVCMALSKTYNAKRDIESIVLWNERASAIYNELKDKRGQAEVLYQKCFADFCDRQYESSMDHAFSGIAMMEELGDEEGVGLGYLRLSRIFHFTMKMAESADYGQKGGQLLEKEGDNINAVDAWSFAGHGYRMSYDSANSSLSFQRSLALAEKTDIQSVLSLAYNDIAAFHMEYDMYEDAETYFIKSLEIADPSNERQIMVIKTGLSQVYLHTGRYEECIEVTKEALVTVEKTNDIFFLSELPEYIAKSYEGLMQYDSAYKYMKLNWQYSDSLFTANQNEALEEMKAKYETEKKEEVISRQKREQLFSIALLLAFGGIIVLLYRRFLSKKKLNTVLEESNKEKDFLVKEIHHRVKNNLQILSSLLSLQSNYITNAEAADAIKEGRNRVESMGMIHQRLYTGEDKTAIDLSEYINDVCAYLEDSFLLKDRKVKIVTSCDVGMADVETVIPLGLIINELITNSVKYAFDESEEGEITVKLSENDNKQLCLEVSDNGRGIEGGGVHQERSTNFGSDLVNVLIKKLKGSLTQNIEDGYKTTIVFDRYKLVAV